MKRNGKVCMLLILLLVVCVSYGITVYLKQDSPLEKKIDYPYTNWLSEPLDENGESDGGSVIGPSLD